MSVRSTQEPLQISVVAGSASVLSTQEVLQISVTAPIMSISYPLNPPNIPGLGPQTVKFAMVDLVGESVSPFTGGQQEQQWPGNWFEIEVNLPPMLRAQAEQWIAWLGALRGKFGNFLMGDYNARTPQGTALGAPVTAGPSNISGQSQLISAGWTPGATLKAGDYIQATAHPGNSILSVEVAHTISGWEVFVTLQSAPTGLVAGGVGATLITFSGLVNATWLNGLTMALFAQAGVVLAFLAPGGAPEPYGPAADSGSISFPGQPQPQRLYKNLLDTAADGGGNMTIQIFPNLRETLIAGLPIVTTNTAGTFRLADNRREWTEDRLKTYGITFKAKEAF